MKPYIGITCGTFRDRDWSPPMNILRRTYIEAVADAGGAPFLIPLVDDEEVMRALYDRLDGLLLSGGGDIDLSQQLLLRLAARAREFGLQRIQEHPRARRHQAAPREHRPCHARR